jgi:hypothetical protein
MAHQRTRWFQIQDAQTFVLAIIIVVAYVIYFGYIVFKDTQDYEGLKNVAATFGTIVAGVVGYYFGNKPVQNAINARENMREEMNKSKVNEIAGIDNSLSVYRNLLDELKKGIKEE